MGPRVAHAWWAGVALALLSYLVLHRLVQPSTMPVASPRDMGGMMMRSSCWGSQLWASTPFRSSYSEAHPCRPTTVATVSARARRGRDRCCRCPRWHALARVRATRGEAFRLQGYAVGETGGGGTDGGVDLVLRRGNDKFLVQCKQWKAFKVPVQPMRELYGVMTA